jgi:hypothetical protein
MVAAREQAWADALADLERARELAQGIGHRYSVGRTHAQLAALYLQRGAAGDRALAAEHASAAQQVFAALGAETELAALPQV